MINKNVDEKVFDTILAEAFKDAAKLEIEALETEGINEHFSPSKSHEQIQRKLYRKQLKNNSNKTYGGLNSFIRVVASILIVLSTTLTIIMFSIPGVRAEFVNVVTQVFDKYVSFEAPNDDYIQDGADGSVLGYIPAGFKLINKVELGLETEFEYYNEDTKEEFKILKYPYDEVSIQHDTDIFLITEKRVDAFTVYIIQNKSDATAKMIWSNSIDMYLIYGNINQEKMLEIVENFIKNLK